MIEGLQDEPSHPAGPTSWKVNITELAKLNEYLINQISSDVDWKALVAAGIRFRIACAISDGLFKNKYGILVGILSSTLHEDPGDHIQFVNSVPGINADQSSYRSELAGVLGILQITEAIVQNHDLRSGLITIALDGYKALCQLSNSNNEWLLCLGQNSFDIISTIRITMAKLPISIKWKWIKDHQAKRGKLPDWWGKQNAIVDMLAKEYWRACISNQIPNTPQRLKHKEISLWMEGTKVSRVDKSTFYAKFCGNDTIQHWQRKHSGPPYITTTIQWPEAQQAMQQLSLGCHRF